MIAITYHFWVALSAFNVVIKTTFLAKPLGHLWVFGIEPKNAIFKGLVIFFRKLF
jgi:hypothetical protein